MIRSPLLCIAGRVWYTEELDIDVVMMDKRNKFKSSPKQGRGGHVKTKNFMNKYAGGGFNSLAFAMKKEKQEKQRNLKSAALREYAKFCKREGIESERVSLGPREVKATEKQGGNGDGEVGSAEEEKSKILKKKKRKGSNPFKKEMREAETLAAGKAEAEKAKLSREEEIAQKLKARKEKSRERMKRTKKGQPIMNDTVKRLLSSIQKST